MWGWQVQAGSEREDFVNSDEICPAPTSSVMGWHLTRMQAPRATQLRNDI